MKKILKWFFGAVFALIALIVVTGLVVTPRAHVERSLQVQADPARVYALVADPRQWGRWSVWHRRDPAMRIEYTGPASGAGAGWAWHSDKEGDGRMAFTSAQPPRRLDFQLWFADFGAASTGSFEFVPEAGGTQVRWSMDVDFGRNPFFRALAPFADRIMGPDLAQGLAALKPIAEQPGG